MHIALLLAISRLASTAAEWVEISQQHYRKPVRLSNHYQSAQINSKLQEQNPKPSHSHYAFTDDDLTKHRIPDDRIWFTHDDSVRPGDKTNGIRPTVNYNSEDRPKQLTSFSERDRIKHKISSLEDGESVYGNRSTTEHNWNKKFHLTDVYIKGNADVSTVRNEDEPPVFKRFDSIKDNGLAIKNKLKDETAIAAVIERVPNIGTIKRVKLSDVPVKSPSTKDRFRDNYTTNKPTFLQENDNSDEIRISTEVFKNSKKHTTTASPFDAMKQHTYNKTSDLSVNNNYKTLDITSVNDIATNNKIQKEETIIKSNTIVDNVPRPFNTITDQENMTSDIKKQFEHSSVNKTIAINRFTDFVTKTNKSEDPSLEMSNSDEITVRNKIKQVSKDKNPSKKKETADINPEDNIESDSLNEIKANTMGNIIKYMKIVADTISKNTRRGVDSKIKYLHELKTTLMANIQDRIDATWPDDDATTSPRRRRRSQSGTARGHVEFPSSESALMTISFLTFAVFLIKLVLQVIQTYKNKAMVVAPLVVAAAGRGGGAGHNKQRFSNTDV